MIPFIQKLKNNIALPWALAFLCLSLAVTQYGGTNAKSRIATMRAITEKSTITIDDYKEWTFDWSLSPNGHYYSNKAPGGALLGLPIFALIDLPALWLNTKPLDEKGRAPEPGYVEHIFLIFFMQLLPFSLLVLALCADLKKRGGSNASIHFFALAALLGNTAAIYMCSYFGHGLAAWLFLLGYFCLRKRIFFLSGLSLAAATLTDYAMIPVLPFLLIYLPMQRATIRELRSFFLGALPFSLLWIWYHYTAFGSPLALASQFINPTQIVPAPGAQDGSAVSRLPSINIIYLLFFGPERGLLITQPWVLCFFALLPWLRKCFSDLLFLVGGFIGLLWLNASVGAWHGGYALGPRYLCLIFPALAYLVALSWNQIPHLGKILLWVGLLESILFRWFTYPFSNLAPAENLFLYHYKLYSTAFSSGKNSTIILRLAIFLFIMLLALYFAGKRERKGRRSAPL